MTASVARKPKSRAKHIAHRLSGFAVLALCGLALSACVVYPAGPPAYYYPHAYVGFGGGYHDGWGGGWGRR